MIKSKKKGLISALLAVSLCFSTLGVITLSNVAIAESPTASMTEIIGEKSDNVTVTPNATLTWGAESYQEKGLSVAGNNSGSWEATINTIFSGASSISYFLPDMSSGNENYTANAFTVKDIDGETVAVFVMLHNHWSWFDGSFGYVYNPATNKYTTQKMDWSTNPPKYGGIMELTPNSTTATGFNTISGGMTFSPTIGASRFSDYYKTKEAADAAGKSNVLYNGITGTLTFVYENDTLTIKTTTYDIGRDEGFGGCGATVDVGIISDVDLSEGYTITMSDAPNVGDFSYLNSSSVFITKINDFSLANATATTSPASEITYDKETKSGDSNVINLISGSTLNSFNFIEKTVLTDEGNKTFAIFGDKEGFFYAGNKQFTANETITVAYKGVSKNYSVKVSGDIAYNVKKLVNNASAGVTVLPKTTKTWGAESYAINGLLVGGSVSRTAAWSAQINGVFKNNASISYSLPDFNGSNYKISTANAFIVKNSSGTQVATFVINMRHWGELGSSEAYVYDAITKKYTTAGGVWNRTYEAMDFTNTVSEITPMKDLNSGFSGFTVAGYMLASPAAGMSNGALKSCYDATSENAAGKDKVLYNEAYGTVFFEYANKTLTIKTTTYNRENSDSANKVGNGQTVTLGVINNVDLDNGYTLTMGSAPDIVVSETESIAYPYNSSILIHKINGYDVSDNTVKVVPEENITCNNIVDENGVVVLGESEMYSFTDKSVAKLGDLAINITASVQTTTLYGNIGEYGANAIIRVSDEFCSKDFAVRVKTLTESLTGTEMHVGAQLRTIEPYGLRFQMDVSSTDKGLIDAAIEDGSVYTEVKYAMIIAPYAYIAQYGDFNVENLFGENAKYGWNGEDDKTQIMFRYTENGLVQNTDGSYKLNYAIVNLNATAVMQQFVSVGVIELTKVDGSKEYKVVSRYDTSADNNVRSCYDIAVIAYEDTSASAPSDEIKKFLLDNYLTPNGYNEGGKE